MRTLLVLVKSLRNKTTSCKLPFALVLLTFHTQFAHIFIAPKRLVRTEVEGGGSCTKLHSAAVTDRHKNKSKVKITHYILLEILG